MSEDEDDWCSIALKEKVAITSDKCCYNYLSIVYSPSGRYGITTYWNCLSHAPDGGFYSARITDILHRETLSYTISDGEVIMRKMLAYWTSEDTIILYFPGLIEWQLFQYKCRVDHERRLLVKLESRLIDKEVLFKDCHAPASTKPLMINKDGHYLEYIAVKSDQAPEKATLLPYKLSNSKEEYKPILLDFSSFTNQQIFVHANPFVHKNKAYFCLRDMVTGISFLDRFLCIDMNQIEIPSEQEIHLTNNTAGVSFVKSLPRTDGTFETNEGAFYEYCQNENFVSFIESFSSENAEEESARRVWTLDLEKFTIDERTVTTPERCIAIPQGHLTVLWQFDLQYRKLGKDCLKFKILPNKIDYIPQLADLCRDVLLYGRRVQTSQELEKHSKIIFSLF